MRKIAIIIVILLSAANLYAQENQADISPPFMFAAPVLETVWYGRTSSAMGFGITLGSEDTVSIGLKWLYALSLAEYDITTFELTIFLRLYLSEYLSEFLPVYLSTKESISGLFAQLNCGAAVFSGDGSISLPEEGGTFTIGITAGWRFLFEPRYLIEPYIRVGYPYFGGAGVSAGMRF